MGRLRGELRRTGPTMIPAFEFNHPMTTLQTEPAASAKFDNNGQYSRTGDPAVREDLRRRTTSARAATRRPRTSCARLGSALRPGVRVLDVGSGIGGAAFHLARAYGAKVTGIDLAEEMVAIAQERARELGLPDSVSFILGDMLETDFPEPFDVIWSRDAFMHIPDKAAALHAASSLLAPGGRLVITDYARGKTPGSPEFERLHQEDRLQRRRAASNTASCSRPPGSWTSWWRTPPTSSSRSCKAEDGRLVANRDEFLGVVLRGRPGLPGRPLGMKIGFCRAGDMKWGIYVADKQA